MNRLNAFQIVALATIFFCSSANAQAPSSNTAPATTEPSTTTTAPVAPPSAEATSSTGSTTTTTNSDGSAAAPISLQGLTPQQVYFKYHETFKSAKTLEDLQPFMAQDIKDKMKKTMESGTPGAGMTMDALLALMKSMEPQGVKLKKEVITGNTATLELTATDQGAFGDALGKGVEQIGTEFAKAFGATPKPGATKPMKSVTTGTVTLHKQEGVWKIGEQKWNTRIGEAAEAKPPSPQQTWAFAAKTIEYPKAPAKGKIKGVPFMVEKAELGSNGILTLRQGKDFFADREFTIFLFGKQGASYENSSYLSPSDNGAHVHMSYKTAGKDLPRTDMYFSKDYGMKLQLGKMQSNKMIPGYIVLRMADKEGSYVQGYFYATPK